MKALLVAVFAFAATLSAQVAPASLTNVDGNGSSSAPFDQGLPFRYQQIHRHVPGPVTITAIAFRRDAATVTAVPRWWSEFVVRMGNGKFERAGSDFTANYLTPPVEVLHRARIVLPDWSVPPTVSPPPFDFVIPLDVPYVHTGQHPLLWEIEVFDQSNSGTLGAIDAFSYPVFTSNQGVSYGSGCGVQLTGFAAVTNENQFYIWNGEWPYAQQSLRLFVYGLGDPDLSLPALCAPLRVDPLLVVDPGFGANYGFYLPHDPALSGIVLRVQAFRLNGWPLQASNAVAMTIPAMPSFGDLDVIQVKQGSWQPFPVLARNGGLVVRLQ